MVPMKINAPLQLFFLLLLLSCLVQDAAAGASGDGSFSWTYDSASGLYGMYDGVSEIGWAYDPIANVFWKIDVVNGQAFGYSMSQSLNYDPTEYYGLFWVSGITEYERYAYDPYSDQVFVFDFSTGFYWVYLRNESLVQTYTVPDEVLSGSEEPLPPVSEETDYSDLPDLGEEVTWYQDIGNNFLWSYATSRDLFLVYEPQYQTLSIYEPRPDLGSYTTGKPQIEGWTWTYNSEQGVLWGYEPGRDMFWIYYEYDNFIQGYAYVKEIYWNVPTQRLSIVEENSFPASDTGDRVVSSDGNEDDESKAIGNLLSLLMLGLLFVALKKRKSRKRREKGSGSGKTPVEAYPPKTWIGKKHSSVEASGSTSCGKPESSTSGVSATGLSDTAKVPEPSKEASASFLPVTPPAAAKEIPDNVAGEAVKPQDLPHAPEPAGDKSPIEGFPEKLLSLYEPLEMLGKGGFATVFRVRKKANGEIVALKIPRIDEKTSSFFIKEVAAWYNLNHPNIVKLYNSDLLPLPYLEMEYVDGVEKDGTHIRELENYPKPLSEAGALMLIKGIAAGLSHAHSKGIFHHDLKPFNILLGEDMAPKITDFGLAKIGARNSLTVHNAYSPLYAAPEQLDEDMYGKPDQRTDIYQLGMVFYELLAGQLPYTGCSVGALLGKIVSKEVKPVSISKANPSLSHYEGIFEKLLAQEKADRYQEVSEFLEALDALEKLDREEEEMKQSLEKTKQTLKMSTSRKEIRRMICEIVEKTSKVALLYARVNEKPELLRTLEDLQNYTVEYKTELKNASAQLEYMIRESIPISRDFEDALKTLAYKVERESKEGAI